MPVDLDAGDVIADLDTDAYVVTRRVAASYAAVSGTGAGVAHPGSTTSFSIDASVQPASGRDLLRLPEGRRSTETRVLYTPTILMTGAQGSVNDADLVTIDGQSWEVQEVQSWPSANTPSGYYFRCTVQVKDV